MNDTKTPPSVMKPRASTKPASEASATASAWSFLLYPTTDE